MHNVSIYSRFLEINNLINSANYAFDLNSNKNLKIWGIIKIKLNLNEIEIKMKEILNSRPSNINGTGTNGLILCY